MLSDIPKWTPSGGFRRNFMSFNNLRVEDKVKEKWADPENRHGDLLAVTIDMHFPALLSKAKAAKSEISVHTSASSKRSDRTITTRGGQGVVCPKHAAC
ncbi:hypothetical protein CDAR_257971 [Caerostris darwini]|uniref:Uncharacterized protein n=1 Tax=Caerostris darwini TaxID=1538125 RepID=A0AAV4WV35_9ARAC|nr:hypothetical protein CDAR_257971 [Caerostris darwini]